MIAEFYKVLLTLYYISHFSCQRQLTTKWKLGLNNAKARNLKTEVTEFLLTFWRTIYDKN
jgi:hypothetical protein